MRVIANHGSSYYGEREREYNNYIKLVEFITLITCSPVDPRRILHYALLNNNAKTANVQMVSV